MRRGDPFVAHIALGLVGGLCLVATATAQAPRDLASLFPQRAEVRADEAGLVRLELPSAVLTACQHGLSDLRLIDRQGHEIPYVVDGGLPPEQTLTARQTVQPRVLDARRATETRENAPSRLTETYVLAVPSVAPEGGFWELVASSRHSRFVRRVTVVAGRPAAGGRVLVNEVSFFRIPDPRRENLTLVLPRLAESELTVTLMGEEGFFLEPTFVFESRRQLPETERIALRLQKTEQRSLDGRTTVRLERPRGLVPDVLELETTSPALSRRVEVWDVGPTADSAPLADRIAQRLESPQEIEIRLRPARGTGLEVVIHDGDSPPLADLEFQAVVRQPALVFSMPAASGGTHAVTLLFGGGRAYSPRYDLAGLIPSSPVRVSGDAARVAERLFDPGQLATATIGAIELNPDFDPAPVLTFAMRPGLEINRRGFSHTAVIQVPESPEGLLRVAVSPEVAAVARNDLGDLRLVDRRDRQWSYLLEKDATDQEIVVYPAAPEKDGGMSEYEIPLPVEPLRIDQLVLDARDEFFDRGFEVVGERTGERVEAVLASGRLVRPLGDPRALRLDFPPAALDRLALRVDDGDDPPLEQLTLAVRVPVSELYFAAPAGRYTLLYGNPDEAAPRYELESVRDVVLATQPRNADLGGSAKNPAFSFGARLSKGSGLQKTLLWGALGIVTLALAWLTLRLARQE